MATVYNKESPYLGIIYRFRQRWFYSCAKNNKQIIGSILKNLKLKNLVTDKAQIRER